MEIQCADCGCVVDQGVRTAPCATPHDCCCQDLPTAEQGSGAKRLPIVWQRLVSTDGRTCDRCGATYEELERAVATLRTALGPLGIEPILVTREIDDPTFRADPSLSNRIWIGNKPIEEWLNASVGSSRCCSVCGDAECRTVELEGSTFETIPEELLIRAALIAAADLLGSVRG